MTVADPRGAFVDRIRNCYAAWMHTPDRGRIRVRWYRVPEPPPGSYPLTDYSSSNFDADTYSYDPPLGEESSSRHPFTDWRDCSPPPWPDPDGVPCPVCPDPVWRYYSVPAMTLADDAANVYVFPPRTMIQQAGGCSWHAPFITVSGRQFWLRMFYRFPGQFWLTLISLTGFPPLAVSWRSATGAGPEKPFSVVLEPNDPFNLYGTGVVKVTGFGFPKLGTSGGVYFVTGFGEYIGVT